MKFTSREKIDVFLLVVLNNFAYPYTIVLYKRKTVCGWETYFNMSTRCPVNLKHGKMEATNNEFKCQILKKILLGCLTFLILLYQILEASLRKCYLQVPRASEISWYLQKEHRLYGWPIHNYLL